ncbi:hypothetical protein ACFZBU_21455 [Embleya sp. NPDC008237]|uniref:hypothetical protein n=1 Tax=Embleya sp. NPDC008237 TaxID=3363978 RepID=UPI0036E00F88
MHTEGTTEADRMAGRILAYRYLGALVHEDVRGPTGREGELTAVDGRHARVRTRSGLEFVVPVRRLVIDTLPAPRTEQPVRHRDTKETIGIYLCVLPGPDGPSAVVQRCDGTPIWAGNPDELVPDYPTGHVTWPPLP